MCTRSQHVGDQRGVTGFLVGRESDEKAIFCTEASSFKASSREFSKSPVEQVKLNPFLVQSQC
jgi:hypothetical protein